LVEAVLVVVFIWFGHHILQPGPPGLIPLGTVCGLLAILAAAMGIQTATLTRIGPLTVHTTFVTGMLNKFAQSVSQWLFWVHDEWRKKVSLATIWRASQQHSAFRNAGFVFTIWISYMAGAVAGTWMDSRWSVQTMYFPAAILFLSGLFDQFRPLSVEEEQEQA
jgi:uncharacterized membrane protein YoaK (UPF0700 family)